VIQAQVGHVAASMMKTYSHIRRQALNEAADALEPTVKPIPSPAPTQSLREPLHPYPELRHSPRHNQAVGPVACLDLLRTMAPQVGFGTAGAERERGAALPERRPGETGDRRSREWLAALDDSRNWLIRKAA
jgi:hypothetical protein